MPFVCALAGFVQCGGAGPLAPLVPRPAVGGPSSWVNITPNPLPSSYPSARSDGGAVYDPDTGTILQFGGQAANGALDQDLWSFAAGKWTELNSGTPCSATTCPSGRSGFGFVYDQADHVAVLFGGVNQTDFGPIILSDTWTYANGVWTNVTATSGTPPSPRFNMAMSYVSAEGLVLLFGGSDAFGNPLGDTWTFTQGSWTNDTPYLTSSPEPRYGASLADSPTGYAALFGGYGIAGLIQNDPSGAPCSYEMWWYHDYSWSPASYTCVGAPPPNSPAVSGSGGTIGPCGRIGAMVAWSPKNHLFVVFGGYGVPTTTGCAVSGSLAPLNDTWVYAGAPGLDFAHWIQDHTPTSLTPRAYPSYAPDYVDGYALIFGGSAGGATAYSDTWRYYAVVSAALGGPLNLTAGSFGFWGTGYFELRAFGGSGDLDYIFNTTLLKTSHSLYGNLSCGNFTNHQGATIPSSYSVLLECQPGPTAYNVYRISVTVWDAQNVTQRAYANWTVTIAPAESIKILPHYWGYFYAGFDLNNYFYVYAMIAAAPVTNLAITIGGYPVVPTSYSNDGYWYNASFNMNMAGPGAVMVVTASISDWSDSANLSLSYVDPPPFVQQLAALAGYVEFSTPLGNGLQTTTSQGKAAYDVPYMLSQTIPLPIGKLFNFSIPVPLISGNYSIVPNAILTFSESSSGLVTFGGGLTLTVPSISLGAFKLSLSVIFKVNGKLVIAPQDGNLSIQWVSASVSITINADFNANIPIWGYKFTVLGYNVSLGFNIDIDIDPSFILSLLLSPSNDSANDIVSGLNLMVTKILGELELPITVTANFGIGIAEISAGGKLELDVIFQISPGSFHPNNLWVNGSIFGKIRFLLWGATWKILGPGIIYYTSGSFLRPRGATGAPVANDGANATWSTDPRTYNTSGYDHLDWTGTATSGTAISDIYPQADPVGAGAYDGAYLFYSNDRVELPVASGLDVSGLRIDAGSNHASGLVLPSDPGFLTTQPVAATLPDGSILVAWDALPVAQASGNSPAGVTTLDVHAARYHPWNGTWGPVGALSSSGIARSVEIDPTISGGRVAVLDGNGLIPTATAPEQLVVYDASTGAVESTATVHGLAKMTSFRSGVGLATVSDLNGNVSLVRLADGSPETLADGAPTNGTPVGGEFLAGSPSTILLWYRMPSGGEGILYDAGSNTALATIPLNGDVTDVEGICGASACSIAAANRTGIARWSVQGASVAPEAALAVKGLGSFGIVQSGGSELYYGLLSSNDTPDAVKSLYVGEVRSPLPPVTAGAPGSGATGPGSPSGNPVSFNVALYLGIPLIASAAVLVVIALRRRRPPGPSTSRNLSPPAASSPPSGELGPPSG